jgi:hypothetical protein
MTSSQPHLPLLSTQADVTALWRDLIRPLGWHRHRVYAVAIGSDRRPLPVMNEIDDLPAALSDGEAHQLMELLAEVGDLIGPEGSFALLYVRPGGGRPSPDDLAVCERLYAAARRDGLPLESIHVGTDDAITPAPMDDVLVAAGVIS